MRTWFMSRNGSVTFSVIAVVIGLALLLLVAIYASLLSERSMAASLLILSGLLFGIGGSLYAGRAIQKLPVGETPGYLRWERGFIIAAVVVNVLGLALLEDMLRAAGDSVLARLGMISYLIGAVVVVVAETAYLSRREWAYSQVVVYVLLAFLAQAAIGVALLRTGLVAGWVGWVTVIWSLAWLVILPIARPRDIYYPWLHYVAPLLIGIALLIQG